MWLSKLIVPAGRHEQIEILKLLLVRFVLRRGRRRHDRPAELSPALLLFILAEFEFPPAILRFRCGFDGARQREPGELVRGSLDAAAAADGDERRIWVGKEQLNRRRLRTASGEPVERGSRLAELTALADVNRGTFYSHYKDLYDMREQMEEELFQQLAAVLSAYRLERAPGGLTPILTAVFRFILENQELFVTTLSGGGEPFFTRLQQLIYEMYLRRWSGFYDLGDTRGTNYYLEFVVSGVMGLVRAWVRGGMAERAEDMASLAEQMIVGGLPQGGERGPHPER